MNSFKRVSKIFFALSHYICPKDQAKTRKLYVNSTLSISNLSISDEFTPDFIGLPAKGIVTFFETIDSDNKQYFKKLYTELRSQGFLSVLLDFEIFTGALSIRSVSFTSLLSMCTKLAFFGADVVLLKSFYCLGELDTTFTLKEHELGRKIAVRKTITKLRELSARYGTLFIIGSDKNLENMEVRDIIYQNSALSLSISHDSVTVFEK